MDCVLKAAMNNNKEERKEMKSGKILAILGMGAIISIGTCVTPVLAGEEDAQTYTFTLEGDTFTLPIKVEDFLQKAGNQICLLMVLIMICPVSVLWIRYW